MRTQSCGAWLMFSRKIFAPAAIIACKTSADSVAGPRVQMILVFRMREGSGNASQTRVERLATAPTSSGARRVLPAARCRAELPRRRARLLLRAGAELEDARATEATSSSSSPEACVVGAARKPASSSVSMKRSQAHLLASRQDELHRLVMRVEEQHESVVVDRLAVVIAHVLRKAHEHDADAADEAASSNARRSSPSRPR